MPNGRAQFKNHLEPAARIRWLSYIFLPDLEFHILGHATDVLPSEWTVPFGL